jgi:hypothetical protein
MHYQTFRSVILRDVPGDKSKRPRPAGQASPDAHPDGSARDKAGTANLMFFTTSSRSQSFIMRTLGPDVWTSPAPYIDAKKYREAGLATTTERE